MSVKKYKISIYSSEVIDLIETLPKGMRTPVIESALMTYMKTDDGRNLLNHLTVMKSAEQDRNGAKPKDTVPELQGKGKAGPQSSLNFLNKFRGDFR
ncbi:MAG: hypothetical protein JW724_03320 [Candidatus Altiarchaeota archaeon]|nr:hypothetical protein [Candidatus Altiarchaeota archaeon]